MEELRLDHGSGPIYVLPNHSGRVIFFLQLCCIILRALVIVVKL